MTGRPCLDKRQWRVEQITQAEALACFRSWHYSRGGPNTGVYRHGLFDDSDRLHGATLWLPPTPTAARAVGGDLWRGVLALSRMAVSLETPKNAATFLLGASMRKIDRHRWPILLTYADTGQGHTGAIYKATNWKCDGPVAAGDTWISAEGEIRGRKRGGRNLTAAEMRSLGYTRRPNLPKIRFIHAVSSSGHGTHDPNNNKGEPQC